MRLWWLISNCVDKIKTNCHSRCSVLFPTAFHVLNWNIPDEHRAKKRERNHHLFHYKPLLQLSVAKQILHFSSTQKAWMIFDLSSVLVYEPSREHPVQMHPTNCCSAQRNRLKKDRIQNVQRQHREECSILQYDVGNIFIIAVCLISKKTPTQPKPFSAFFPLLNLYLKTELDSMASDSDTLEKKE